jgi:ribokinase
MPRLTVLGSLNMDISVAVRRLPAAGETVLGSSAVIAPGGKGANQAVAAARLGAAVRMIGCTGDDGFGEMARSALEAEGVDITGVRVAGGSATGLALITVDSAGENIITVAAGANGLAGPAETDAALAAGGDVLVLSAEIPRSALAAALADARAIGLACVLNLAPAPSEPAAAAALLDGGVDWLVVNQSEAGAVLGRDVAGLDEAGAAARDLLGLGARHAVVTAGSRGAAVAGAAAGEAGSEARPAAVPAFSVDSVDSVGAGDAFVAALGVAVAAGAAAVDAVRLACAAGATATTRRGTQDGLPRPSDILAATGVSWPVTAD